jgi:hypothetical protein
MTIHILCQEYYRFFDVRTILPRARRGYVPEQLSGGTLGAAFRTPDGRGGEWIPFGLPRASRIPV